MKKRTIALIASMVAAFVFGACSGEPATIDVAEYLEYEIDGFSGEGELTYKIDYDALLEDNKSLKDCTSSKVKKAIRGKWDKTAELKNGDEISFTWDIDDKKIEDEYNVRFEADDIEVVVKDLKEMSELDPFDYVDVKFTGISPNGDAEINVRNSELPVEELQFEFDVAHGLSNGDRVTVSLRNGDPEELCREQGYILTAMSRTYTVDGLEEYVDSIEDLNGEIIDTLWSQARDLFNAKTKWAPDETITDLSLYGFYLAHLKEGLKTDYLHVRANVIWLILEVSVEHTSGTVKYYYYVSFNDLIKSQDGTIKIENLYETTNPIGFEVAGNVTGDAFADERGENMHYYVGFLNTSDIYRNVIREYNEYYNIEKSFEEDGVGGLGELDGDDENEG